MLLGLLQVVPLAISLIYSEWYSAEGFFLTGLIIAGLGFGLHEAVSECRRTAVQPFAGYCGFRLAGHYHYGRIAVFHHFIHYTG